jgi:hypothetical protein
VGVSANVLGLESRDEGWATRKRVAEIPALAIDELEP